jgi:hypothetical protein
MKKHFTFLTLFLVFPLVVFLGQDIRNVYSENAVLKRDARIHFKICPRCAGQWERDIDEFCSP